MSFFCESSLNVSVRTFCNNLVWFLTFERGWSRMFIPLSKKSLKNTPKDMLRCQYRCRDPWKQSSCHVLRQNSWSTKSKVPILSLVSFFLCCCLGTSLQNLVFTIIYVAISPPTHIDTLFRITLDISIRCYCLVLRLIKFTYIAHFLT